MQRCKTNEKQEREMGDRSAHTVDTALMVKQELLAYGVGEN